MVKTNKTYSIDHEIAAKFKEVVGARHESVDLEAYMKSRVEEYQKIKAVLDNPVLETCHVPNENSADPVFLGKQKLIIDVLNMNRADLNKNLSEIGSIRKLGKIQGNADMVKSVAKNRIERLKRGEWPEYFH